MMDMKPHTARLKWITPDAEKMVIDCARVSSDPDAKKMPDERLLAYLIRNDHFSPFEMGNMCLEIFTTRDIARQILRHRSFSFQEFSQRYADVEILGNEVIREARMQHPTNRQMSLPCEYDLLAKWWEEKQKILFDMSIEAYDEALGEGIAKEVARAILPEGLTPSRMFMNGTLRSWIHFIKVRSHETAQKEVRLVAQSVSDVLREHCPVIFEATQK